MNGTLSPTALDKRPKPKEEENCRPRKRHEEATRLPVWKARISVKCMPWCKEENCESISKEARLPNEKEAKFCGKRALMFF